jgi:hypothetical protein
MPDVKFTDNSAAVKKEIASATTTWLRESAEILKNAVRNLTRVKTGQTKGSFDYYMTKQDGEDAAVVGSPLENAIWEEFGTGEYALEGNGRKGGWFYEDNEGNGHYTYGKTPSRALYYAIKQTEKTIKKRYEELLGGVFK